MNAIHLPNPAFPFVVDGFHLDALNPLPPGFVAPEVALPLVRQPVSSPVGPNLLNFFPPHPPANALPESPTFEIPENQFGPLIFPPGHEPEEHRVIVPVVQQPPEEPLAPVPVRTPEPNFDFPLPFPYGDAPDNDFPTPPFLGDNPADDDQPFPPIGADAPHAFVIDEEIEEEEADYYAVTFPQPVRHRRRRPQQQHRPPQQQPAPLLDLPQLPTLPPPPPPPPVTTDQFFPLNSDPSPPALPALMAIPQGVGFPPPPPPPPPPAPTTLPVVEAPTMRPPTYMETAETTRRFSNDVSLRTVLSNLEGLEPIPMGASFATRKGVPIRFRQFLQIDPESDGPGEFTHLPLIEARTDGDAALLFEISGDAFATPLVDLSQHRIMIFGSVYQRDAAKCRQNRGWDCFYEAPDSVKKIRVYTLLNSCYFNEKMFELVEEPKITDNGSLSMKVKFDRFGINLKGVNSELNRKHKLFVRFSIFIENIQNGSVVFAPFLFQQHSYKKRLVVRARSTDRLFLTAYRFHLASPAARILKGVFHAGKQVFDGSVLDGREGVNPASFGTQCDHSRFGMTFASARSMGAARRAATRNRTGEKRRRSDSLTEIQESDRIGSRNGTKRRRVG